MATNTKTEVTEQEREEFWKKIEDLTIDLFKEEDEEGLMFDVVEELLSNCSKRKTFEKVLELAQEVLETSTFDDE